jgi:cell division protein FtsQ
VPIVTGPVLLHLEALKKVLLTLRDDDFFGPRITEVAVKEDGTFELRLRHENYFLCLGQSTDLTRKLRNFKAFYQSMAGDPKQMKYKKIDLRFNNQVVATE